MANLTIEETNKIIDQYIDKEWAKVKACKEFPSIREFSITEEHMIQEFKNLCNKPLKNKAKSDIIRYFFPSMFTANKGGHLSPVEYWNKIQEDKEEFRKFLFNRLRQSDWFNEKNGANRKYLYTADVPLFIYAIGVTTSGKAPCVSYMKPAMIKNLILKYAPDCEEVFDPCTGYSKFLGALAAGKKYIGRDISDILIQENKNCLAFIEKNFPQYKGMVDLDIANAFTSTYKGDVLCCCPPYSKPISKTKTIQIEEWRKANGDLISCKYTCDEIITKFLRNYDMNKYIFIVDDSMQQYRDYIAEKHENINYINSRQGKLTSASHNFEAIVVITKEERNEILKELNDGLQKK